MQELIEIPKDLSALDGPSLVLGIANTPQELEAVQRLRYEVYTQEMGVHFPEAIDGRDVDHFDEFCQHLIVMDTKEGKAVGTYRILSPQKAVEAGGYYSESEFDLSEFEHLRPELNECGRSCTHPDYRDGGVIMLLWSGLAQFMRCHGLRYLFGCASVSLLDDGVQAAQVWQLAKQQLVEFKGQPKVTPHHPYPIHLLEEKAAGERISQSRMPALIKGYLKLGARICGEPAWDKDFNAVDFPVIVDIENMDRRYRRHFGFD
ncbi:N-acyl amino acid synthase, PEP-CTERM/exosortase system-associated [Oligella urethralis]|uniref:GNAT family N-acetyltransferase n=1 Tax=Oligella urethralis TaxID=90245 RepID=UPI000377E3E7|nr:GNAT family N-acyltransferase [Oligella urethralis]MDK6202823.1 GNAT family N-acyltransferase [Oligella urethralis]SUA54597.1 N-acyl amino acid synthase, PEP-CTERM/exosortase system-associated [Oligella urethralis]SUA68221.1 N-acyl amino acid synthase, PEP-CTERM/exosortase system-associated [Oligella urethralis]